MSGQVFQLLRELLESTLPEGFKEHIDMALGNIL